VIALCHDMIFNGSNVALRSSVRSIATLAIRHSVRPENH
jgi:hypothetical protein